MIPKLRHDHLVSIYIEHYTRLEGLGYTFTDAEGNPVTKEEAAELRANQDEVVIVDPA